MKPDRAWTIYPFAYAVYPSLFLYLHNLDWVRPQDLAKPLVVTVVAAAVFLALARALMRSGTKAGALVTICLVVVFSYGHVLRLTQGLPIGRTMVLFPTFGAVMLAAVILIARTKRDLQVLSSYLRTLGMVLLAIICVQIGIARAGADSDAVELWSRYVDMCCSETPRLSANTAKPDIYYIILDNYSRADILKNDLGYDNSSFIDFLRRKGFYVADQSYCNHLGTLNSLPSALNMDYLQTLRREAGVKTLNKQLALSMIRKSKLVQLLKKSGYEPVAYATGFSVTAEVGAEVVYKRSFWSMSEFDRVLLNTTMLSAPMAMLPARVFSSVNEMENHRNDVLHTFRRLAETPRIKGPKFAFVHLTVAHPPFMFDAKGNLPKVPVESLTSNDQLRGYDLKLYTDSITFLNGQIERIVDRILATSAKPPVIIIQGDHGASHNIIGRPRLSDFKRHAILNAYYLPGDGKRALYPSISPVNSFRVVMNEVLGAHYPLLKDVQQRVNTERE